MSQLKVLIVEDDDILSEIYMLKFELEGLDVMHAENGKVALQVVDEFKPDAILLDLMMPVMDGWEFMSRFHGSGRSSRVIVFSNMLSAENKQKAKKLGAISTWVKSDFTPEMAAQKIVELCA